MTQTRNGRVVGLKVRTHVGEGAWCAEMAIPFAAMGITNSESGAIMGLNLRRQRTTKPSVQELARRAFAWSTHQTTTPAFIPEHFGTLIFGTLQHNLRLQLRSTKTDVNGTLSPLARRQLVRLRKRIATNKNLSVAQWRQISAAIERWKDSRYWDQFAGSTFVVWRHDGKRDDEVGLESPPLKPPAAAKGLKVVPVAVERGDYIRESILVTNVTESKKHLRVKVQGVTSPGGESVSGRPIVT